MNDNPFDQDRAYTIPDFVKRSGIGRTTVYDTLKTGKLHARTVGRHTVITNAHEWFGNLPVYRSGANAYGVAA